MPSKLLKFLLAAALPMMMADDNTASAADAKPEVEPAQDATGNDATVSQPANGLSDTAGSSTGAGDAQGEQGNASAAGALDAAGTGSETETPHPTLQRTRNIRERLENAEAVIAGDMIALLHDIEALFG